MADLPEISQDLDTPLPQVDPNSQLVPYRMASRPPTGPPKVTTGYGPRARPAVQPPGAGGMAVPDLSGLMGAAFQHLPIDQAEKAIEMATRFVGQRGYQRDMQSGLSAEQAFAKWAPMLFHSNPVGMSTALKGATPIPPPQSTPYGTTYAGHLYPPKATPSPKLHVAANGEVIQENPDGSFKVVRQPTKPPPSPKIHVGAKGEILRENPDGTVEVVREGAKPELSKAQEQDLKDAYKELDVARKDFDAATPKKKDAARLRVASAQSRINAIKSTAEAKTETPNPAQTKAAGERKRVRVVGPNGQKGTIEEGDTLPEGWKQQ